MPSTLPSPRSWLEERPHRPGTWLMVRNDATPLNLPGKGGTMSMPIIKYTPDIEAADPRFDETLQTVIAKTERYIAGSVTTEGTGRAVRDAHAKGYGLVRAEVDILD